MGLERALQVEIVPQLAAEYEVCKLVSLMCLKRIYNLIAVIEEVDLRGERGLEGAAVGRAAETEEIAGEE